MKNRRGTDTRDTLRKILQSLMTKDLAIQFSYTRLDRSRHKTKLEFGSHSLCNIILGTALISIWNNIDATL